MDSQDRWEDELPNGWDEHFCFNIVDFTPGSRMAAQVYGKREWGNVVSSDQNYLTVTYRADSGARKTVGINSIVYLDW